MENEKSIIDCIKNDYPKEEQASLIVVYNYFFFKMALLFLNEEELTQRLSSEEAYYEFLDSMVTEMQQERLLYLHPSLPDKVVTVISKLRGKYDSEKCCLKENEFITEYNQYCALSDSEKEEKKLSFQALETLSRAFPRGKLLSSDVICQYAPEVGLLSEEDIITYTLMDFENFDHFIHHCIILNDASYVATLSYLTAFQGISDMSKFHNELLEVLDYVQKKSLLTTKLHAKEGLKRAKQYQKIQKKNPQ